ncbi:MAG: hypothetical protein O7E52_08950 [Candidatus Poribacteria bacterium]|nr:hypothetical protein [Candidatus Poribacteria bacterium]
MLRSIVGHVGGCGKGDVSEQVGWEAAAIERDEAVGLTGSRLQFQLRCLNPEVRWSCGKDRSLGPRSPRS